jgi:glycosyltransferase 2 family protein
VRFWAIFIATNLLSLACLIWVLNGANLGHIWHEARHMHWRWVVGAVITDVCVYLLHAWRWRLLLRPIEVVPFAYLFEAIYVGLFANEVLPLRAGELIRCFLLSRSSTIPISVTFASALIERIFDGVWLMICFFICLQMGELPGVLLKGGYILGGFIVVCAAFLAYGMYSQRQSGPSSGWKWPKWFATLIEDLHLIGHSRYLYFSFLVSGLYMLAQILPIYMLIEASDLPVPWTASFVMMVLLRLTSIVPQAPGNLGSFQWVAARTLMMFGMVTAHAKRFSLILWAVVTLPLILIGSIALALTGLNMNNLQRQAAEAVQSGRASKTPVH